MPNDKPVTTMKTADEWSDEWEASGIAIGAEAYRKQWTDFIKSIQNDALEKAANACEALVSCSPEQLSTKVYCAERIRSIKSQSKMEYAK